MFKRPLRLTSAAHARRVAAGLSLAVSALLFSGCNTVSADQDHLALFAMNAPMPKMVAEGQELFAAEQAAKAMPGCVAVRGTGSSMEPVYLAGTAVVIRGGGFDKLRAGQPVVYKSSRGNAVAHMLIRQTAYGWIAQGLNNNGTDSDLVTENNLVGVITQAFASKTGPLPKAVAARVALNDQIGRADTVASLGR